MDLNYPAVASILRVWAGAPGGLEEVVINLKPPTINEHGLTFDLLGACGPAVRAALATVDWLVAEGCYFHSPLWLCITDSLFVGKQSGLLLLPSQRCSSCRVLRQAAQFTRARYSMQY